MRFRIATAALGSKARLTVLRNGQTREAHLPVMPPPETPPRNPTELTGNHPLAGAVVASLSPALSEELDLPGAWEGVVVLKTKRGTPARRVGFRAGDIIHSIDRKSFSTSEELVQHAPQLSAQSGWRVRFSRKGKVRDISLKR